MLRCPRCGQPAARRSRRSGAWDHLASVLHLYPFRCRLCATRFRAFQARHHSQHGTDRRENDRLLVRVPVTLSGGGERAEGETVDLSLGGCSVSTAAVLAAGATVTVGLRLGEAGEVHVESAVVRVQGDGRAGLQFARMAAPDRERLGRYLARLLRPPGGVRRRRPAPRPQVLLAAAVGLAVIVLVFLLMDRVAGPPVR